MKTIETNRATATADYLKRCECGCGEIVKPQNRYIPGHHARKGIRYSETPGPLDSPCRIWQLAILKNGYGLERRGDKMVYAHRAAYEAARGEIPPGLSLDHLCRVRACVNPDHLEAVTPAENARRGASAKLTHAQVAEIRASPIRQRVLARRFGVSQSQISRVRNGRSWV